MTDTFIDSNEGNNNDNNNQVETIEDLANVYKLLNPMIYWIILKRQLKIEKQH